MTPATALAFDGREATAYALTIRGRKAYEISVDDLERFERAYPEVNVRREFGRMDAWLYANTSKRPTHRGAARFVNSWLANAVDKAARDGASAFQATRAFDGELAMSLADKAASRLRAIDGNATGRSMRNDVSHASAAGPYVSTQLRIVGDH